MRILAVLSILALTIASCVTPNLNEESGQELQDQFIFSIDKDDVIPPGEREGTTTDNSQEIDKDDVIPPGERE